MACIDQSMRATEGIKTIKPPNKIDKMKMDKMLSVVEEERKRRKERSVKVWIVFWLSELYRAE